MLRCKFSGFAASFTVLAVLLTAGCGSKDKGEAGGGPPGSSAQVQADAQKRAADQGKMYQQGGQPGAASSARPPGAPAGVPMPSGPPR